MTEENDSDSSSTDSSDSDNSQVNMDLDATFAELLENLEKCAAIDRVFTDIGVPPVSDWVSKWELSKATQIQEAKRIADMATASNDPKNLVKPVLKLSDPKLVLAPGRFPPISNPNLSSPSSANISQPTANDQSNPPFNNQGQSSGGARPPGMPNSSGGGDGWDNGFNPNNNGTSRRASAQNLEEDVISVLSSVTSNSGGLVAYHKTYRNTVGC